MKYVFDEMGNRFEGMSKEEILQSIGAGGDRECVFTSEIECNGEIINFNYTGVLPDDTIVRKLLIFGLNPALNNLTEQDVTAYIALQAFSINFYQCETELYITNATHEKLSFINLGIGRVDVYPRTKDFTYNIISKDERMKIKKFDTKQEYDATVTDNETWSIVIEDDIDANNATNVTTSINDIPLYQIFQSDGKTVKNAVNAANAANATNAANAANATNVTTKINDIPLYEIFEENGRDVKYATSATGAVNASIALRASYDNDRDIEIHNKYRRINRARFIGGTGDLMSNSIHSSTFLTNGNTLEDVMGMTFACSVVCMINGMAETYTDVHVQAWFVVGQDATSKYVFIHQPFRAFTGTQAGYLLTLRGVFSINPQGYLRLTEASVFNGPNTEYSVVQAAMNNYNVFFV